ncbi:MAG: hypothetical protein IT323_11135, partial [Anaerolineae bacterium]|nr:hypothetical protein [Anaerolineae bacterium]
MDFASRLIYAQGIPGDDVIARAHEVGFAAEDLAEISQAINAGCEHIDPRDWDAFTAQRPAHSRRIRCERLPLNRKGAEGSTMPTRKPPKPIDPAVLANLDSPDFKARA